MRSLGTFLHQFFKSIYEKESSMKNLALLLLAFGSAMNLDAAQHPGRSYSVPTSVPTTKSHETAFNELTKTASAPLTRESAVPLFDTDADQPDDCNPVPVNTQDASGASNGLDEKNA